MLAALLAATLLWSPYDAALARAKNEPKLVLVHLRATFERANVEPDAKLERAVANENIALMLDAFVIARNEGRLPGINVDAPALAVVDPDGRLVLSQKIGSEEKIGSTLGGLREATGGVAFQTTRAAEQPAVFAKIRDDVRGQYLITFQPRAAKAGTWRSLVVRTRRGDLKVRTVSGYYAR